MIELSVLMPVYNAENYLREAIESILNQSYTNFEFIIVNDGSTDKSEEIIRSYNDERIKLVTRENGGVSKALNTGLAHSNGKYIARMDADDIAHVDRLALQMDFIKNNPEYILVGSNANGIDEEGNKLYAHKIGFYEDEEIKKALETDCVFVHSSVIFLKEVVMDSNMYPEKAHSFEDHVLWNNIKEKGKFKNFDLELIDYRFSTSSVTVDKEDYEEDFLLTKQKVLNTGVITDEDEQVILKSLQKIDKTKKEISYHRLLAKKYLWNNYQPKKSRKHSKEVYKLEGFTVANFALYALSFFPEKVIKYLYEKSKKQSFDRR